MSKDSAIQWTDHTFNPWRGCAKVSPGCEHCYAEARSRRFGAVQGEWGPSGRRVVAAPSTWAAVRRWARQPGRRRRVFCASLADVFEDYAGRQVVDHKLMFRTGRLTAVRATLFDLIRLTPELDWLLLTKRPQNFARLVEEAATWLEEVEHGALGAADTAAWLLRWLGGEPPENVWVGASVEDQARAALRLPRLAQIPARVRFVSAEPLLGRVDFGAGLREVDWVIVGGESGAGCRRMDPEWARDIMGQCRRAGARFFMKQLGGHPGTGKGGALEEMPADLQVREFPQVAWRKRSSMV